MISLEKLSSVQRDAVVAVQRAASEGSVYLVGGVVRDLFLGRAVGDVDVVVAGVPLETLSERLEKVGRTDLVGKRFGVIKFTLPDGPTLDIALPRTEHALSGSGHRRDFAVDFDPNLPIERDLERRDFTVNAMAARLEHDGSVALVDAFGGREDLERKRIRAVGDPGTRFGEDFSRMLRGIRFACELGFEIEPVTWRAIQEHMAHLEDKDASGDFIVPREVVAKELLRALLGNPPAAFDLFDTSGAFRVLIPELYAMQGCP
ncbi:MAG: RNA nucleotidyltransferase, partial [bacterium]|nr:RNA nucleotidyltransferase [bacterium]